MYVSVAAPGFWFGWGEHRTKFYTNPLKSCTAIASPKFRFGSDIQQKCIHRHQRLLKNFEKFIKNLHKNLKILQNFSKIKFNRISNVLDNLIKFTKI